MLDSDWSRKFLLRSDWLLLVVASMTTSDKKPCACQKLGNSPGVGKCRAPGQSKICKCPSPGTDKVSKRPTIARGGGGGLGAAGIDWCITHTTNTYLVNPRETRSAVLHSSLALPAGQTNKGNRGNQLRVCLVYKALHISYLYVSCRISVHLSQND